MTQAARADTPLGERLDAVVRYAGAGIVACDRAGRLRLVNQRFCEIVGRSEDELLGLTFRDLTHPEDMPATEEALKRSLEAGAGTTVEKRYLRPDGTTIWVRNAVTPLPGADGDADFVMAVVTDIDDQVRLREQLEMTNEHLRLLGDASHAVAGTIEHGAAIEAVARVIVPSFADWCAIDTLDGNTLVRTAAVHSPRVDEHVARVLRESAPRLEDEGDPLANVVRSGEALFLPEIPGQLSIFARAHDDFAVVGAPRLNSSIMVPLRAGGHIFGAMTVARFEGRHHFNERDYATVLVLAHRFSSLLDRAKLFFEVTRALGNLRLLADAGLALSTSGELDEALDRATGLLVPGYADFCTVDVVDDDVLTRVKLAHSERINPAVANVLREVSVSTRESSDVAIRIVSTGEPVLMKRLPAGMSHLAKRGARYRRAAAELGGGSSMGVPLRVGERIFGVLGLMRVEGRAPFDESDIALALELGRQLGGWIERARLFSELRQALAARDEFFGFVSHELKTPLTTVVGVADVLARRYPEMDESERIDAVGLIRRDSLRLEGIIANMLTLARSERVSGDEPALVQHVVAAAVAGHRQRHPQRSVEVHSTGSLSPVLAPSGWLDRVVENLLSNAEKYSEPETPIEVELAEREGFVEVRVLDRGRGIPPEQLRDVFEPFFRANPNEQGVSGVGLGLTVCHRLVDRLGGEVWVAPREGGGTEAGFRVPVMEVPED